jgi:hypothetical protein
VEKMRAEAKEMRSGGGDARRGGELLPCGHRAALPAGAKAVSWARPAAHDTHGRPCRAGWAHCRPCHAAHGPCQKVVPWAVPPAHGPFVHL